ADSRTWRPAARNSVCTSASNMRFVLSGLLFTVLAAFGAGCADLDCFDDGALEAAYLDGQAAAERDNAAAYEDGYERGLSLTRRDGERAGAANGYDKGYDDGYRGPGGYHDGFDDGFARGKTEGSTTTACHEGAAHGAADGDGAG